MLHKKRESVANGVFCHVLPGKDPTQDFRCSLSVQLKHTQHHFEDPDERLLRRFVQIVVIGGANCYYCGCHLVIVSYGMGHC
jgi:hypothetical protein